MAEIMLDFIQCHHCEKRFRPDDPEANNHWRECPNSPARKVVEEMKTLLLKIRKVLQRYHLAQLVTLVNEIDELLGEAE